MTVYPETRQVTLRLTSITTTLPQSGSVLAGNRFVEGKATKLSSAWAGSHEEVLKVPFLRSVVVILGVDTGSSMNCWSSTGLSTPPP